MPSPAPRASTTTTTSPHSLYSASYSPRSLGANSDDGGRMLGDLDRGRREETPPAPCSVLCGPRSCSTLPPSLSKGQDSPDATGGKRRTSRLWVLRGLVKMFRRKVKRRGTEDPVPSPPGAGTSGDDSSFAATPHQPSTMRARSASELLGDNANRGSSGPYNQGISVSHDSVFSPDSPPEPTIHATPAPLSLATRGVNMSELKAALRRRAGSNKDGGHVVGSARRITDEDGSGDDDPGLPRSPPTSPTTVDVLNHGLKNASRATRSTCSDGSLLSMGSSELEEDSMASLHSSKHSLGDGSRHLQVVDHEPVAGEAPLNHTAARHKMAVRPRRTHALTRPRRSMQVPIASILPTTLEVNEESSVCRVGVRPASCADGPATTSAANHPPVVTQHRGASDLAFASAMSGSHGQANLNYNAAALPPLVTQPVSHKSPQAHIDPLNSVSHKPLPGHFDALNSAKHKPLQGHFDPLNYHPDPHHHLQQQYPASTGPIVSQPSSQMDQQLVHQYTDCEVAGESERREDPLLARLFGSVRSGRRRSRSRHDTDDVREGSSSPLRHESKQRFDANADAKLLTRSSSRAKLLKQQLQQQKEEDMQNFSPQQQLDHHSQPIKYQEQQQQEIQYYQQNQFKVKSRSVENRQLDSTDAQGTRSSSVEGRIEGHEEEGFICSDRKLPINVNISSYKERSFYSPVRNESNVKKAKSFRDVGQPEVAKRNSSRRSWFGRESSNEHPIASAARLSASYDSLEDNIVTPKGKPPTPSQSIISLLSKEAKKSIPAKSAISPALSSTLSSTDSLTVTEIPGVYIRPLSQYKKTPVGVEEVTEHPSYFCTQQSQFSNYTDVVGESCLGPLSLDSSITPILREDDNIRKTSSSDHVSANTAYMNKSSAELLSKSITKTVVSSQHDRGYENYVGVTNRDSLAESSVTEIEVNTNYQSKFSSYVPGPVSVLRSMSLSTSDTNNSNGILSRRASSADELEQQHEGRTAASTRTRYRKRELSLSGPSSCDAEQTSVPEFMRIQLNKVDNKPQRIIYTTEDEGDDTSVSRTRTEQDKNRIVDVATSIDSANYQIETTDKESDYFVKQRIGSNLDNSRRESNISQSSLSSCGGDSSDDVILRRPLRREKSLVMDSTSSKKKEDEPELFKVFARRSFKVRDCFNASDTADDDDEEDQLRDIGDPSELVASLSSQKTGVTKINPIYSTPTPPRTPIISSSFGNKFAVGSPAIPFKPPVNIPKDSPPVSPFTSETVTGEYDENHSELLSFDSNIVNAFVSKVVSTQSNKISSATSFSGNIASVSSKSSTFVSNTSEGSRINIRPMVISKENNYNVLATTSSASEVEVSKTTTGNFASDIISRASSGASSFCSISKTSTTVSQVSSSTSLQSCNSNVDSVTVNSSSVTTVIWPPKSISKSSSLQSSPFAAQVKPEQLSKYATPNKNVEIIDSKVIMSENKDQECNSDETEAITDELTISQVQSVRRKFMNAAPSSVASSVVQSAANSNTRPLSSTATAPTVIEARNTVPAFTVTVRSTQSSNTRHSSFNAASRSHSSAGSSPFPSVGSSSAAPVNHHRHSIGGAYVPHPRQQVPCNTSPSPPAQKRKISSAESTDRDRPVLQSDFPHSAIIQGALSGQQSGQTFRSTVGQSSSSKSSVSPVPSAADGIDVSSSGEDWRSLVRQRREDRLKQTKSVEMSDDASDGRVSSNGSRSSKVLEMASNFQKLQVA